MIRAVTALALIASPAASVQLQRTEGCLPYGPQDVFRWGHRAAGKLLRSEGPPGGETIVLRVNRIDP